MTFKNASDKTVNRIKSLLSNVHLNIHHTYAPGNTKNLIYHKKKIPKANNPPKTKETESTRKPIKASQNTACYTHQSSSFPLHPHESTPETSVMKVTSVLSGREIHTM